jgi:hypothetical protein
MCALSGSRKSTLGHCGIGDYGCAQEVLWLWFGVSRETIPWESKSIPGQNRGVIMLCIFNFIHLDLEESSIVVPATDGLFFQSRK